MKIKYDPEVDVLVITFSEAEVLESEQAKKDVILDFDKDGNIVSIEILDASKKGGVPTKLEYELVSK